MIPKIKINSYPPEVLPFIKFVKKMYTLNKWDDIDKLEIILDYRYDGLAGFFIQNTQYKNKIFINPHRCQKEQSEEYSITYVLLHEFSHLLNFHFRILKEYQNLFVPFVLVENSLENREEELAEAVMTYLLNKTLLKMTNKRLYLFLSKFFKVPKTDISLPENYIKGLERLNEKPHYDL